MAHGKVLRWTPSALLEVLPSRPLGARKMLFIVKILSLIAVLAIFKLRIPPDSL